ncbi:MAG: copper chaperone PCu(A)C [Pseudomonadota bacterium]
MKRHLLIISVLLGVALSGCGQPAAVEDPTPITTETDAGEITVRGLFVVAPLGGRDVTSGGGEVTISGDGEIKLVEAHSPIARSVELHTHSAENGVMQMRQVQSFAVTADHGLVLGPGGPHLMLFGVQDGVSPGDVTEITLVFEQENGETKSMTLEAEVHDFSAVGRGS